MKSKILLSLFAVLFLMVSGSIAFAETGTVRLQIEDNSTGAVLTDAKITIYDSGGTLVRSQDTIGGLASYDNLVFTNMTTGSYYVYAEVPSYNKGMGAFNISVGSDFKYSIKLVNVSVNPTDCIRAKPTIKITPDSQTSYAGGTSKYFVEVFNNDNEACGSSHISTTFPKYGAESKNAYHIRTSNDFPGGIFPPINPGTSQKSTMFVDVLSNAQKGTYYMTMVAEHQGASIYADARYSDTIQPSIIVADKVVDQNCVRSKPTVKVTPESQTGFAGETSKYIVEVFNNDNEFCAPSEISLTLPKYEAESRGAYGLRAFNEFPGGIGQPIKSGASYKSTLFVDVLPSTPKGTYYVTLVAQNQNTPIQSDAAYSVAVRPSIVIVERSNNEGHKCTDSDGGKNYYVKGVTQDYFVGDTDYVGGDYTDYCYEYPETDEGHRFSVVEYWCEDKGNGQGPSVYVGGYYCPRGCDDGSCIGEQESTSDRSRIIPPRPAEQNIPENSEKSVNLRASCNGCLSEENCLPYGTRMQKESSKYCEVDKAFKEQKSEGSACQNNYECTSNFCTDGQCVNIQKELKETKGLLQTILDFLKKLFNFG